MKPKISFLFVALGMFVELTSCWSQNNEYLSTFETVWKKVNESYYDRTFIGLNWKDAMTVIFRRLPQLRKTKNFTGWSTGCSGN